RKKKESKEYFESSYSTITLDENYFYQPRVYKKGDFVTIIMSDVSMNNAGKGEYVFIDAIKDARDNGYDVRGVGRCLDRLKCLYVTIVQKSLPEDQVHGEIKPVNRRREPAQR
ncbi:MAG: hypothetical protein J5933_03685, partial [Clostridia bacterium]|nr:hypothetical protein [Clostridia bacterium]